MRFLKDDEREENGEDRGDKVRVYARECFERTLEVARATENAGFSSSDIGNGDAFAFVHDVLKIAREITESALGENTTSDDIFRVYDRVVVRCKEEAQKKGASR